MSIKEELDRAVREKNIKKVAYIGKAIKDYIGPKDVFLNDTYAYKALEQIRAYRPSSN